MTIDTFFKASLGVGLGFALAACSSGLRSLPATGGGNYSVTQSLPEESANVGADASKILATPASLALLSTGSIDAKSVTVHEKGYTGTFTQTSTCAKIATASPTTGNGPSLAVKITGIAAGSCNITFTDSAHKAVTLPITVTTVIFKLTSASISPASKSVSIVLTSVNGKAPPSGIVTKITPALPACTTSCTFTGPQAPPGSDVFTLQTFDSAGGTGNLLATGSIDVTVVAAKAASPAPVLAKVPKFVVLGTVPSGSAGTAFSAPVTLPVTVEDADHDTISGTYSTPVKITDNDATPIAQGSSLVLDAAAASRSISSTKSTDTIKLNYLGLAMLPVTLTASATGATGTSKSFAPKLAAIVNNVPSGPLAAHEIDLYNNVSGQSGFQGTVTPLTQLGWRGGAFANNFTYVLGGTSNNCSTFVVTAASGTSNTYAVHTITSGTPKAGKCTMTLTGGATALTNVLLTYTTSGIGVGLANGHRPAAIR